MSGAGKLGYLEVFFILMYIATKNELAALRLLLILYFSTECNTPGKCHTIQEDSLYRPSSVYKTYNNSVFTLTLNMLRIFLIFVLCMLLHIGCVELNPGPNDTDHEESTVSSINDSSVTRALCEIFSKSVSFLHLNIQSLVPKLDLITAEYEDFDILSFSESWLNDSITDDSINILNYHSPFRKDRG